MRLFEATGAGACLMTDRKVNLAEMFEPDVEVVTYSSVEECSEKVRYLLDHDSERESIAAAGQRRVLRDHTFENRARFLNDLITQALK
jgi:spore maturation protein CgeB